MAAAAVAVCGAEQKEPAFYSNTAIQNVSPNGKWAVSEVYGTVVLINIETGEEVVFQAGEVGSPYYNLGMGNVLSDDGLLLCQTEATGKACYYHNGEWKELYNGDAGDVNGSANGITPDGSRICGNLDIVEMTMEDVTMVLPAVWDRQADGSYGEYVILPHPELDFTGRAPQYITAVAISDDGRTVVGQIVDCRGTFHYPIVYTQGADGEWSYTLPTESLINPNHVVMPENPGESPERPQPTSYLNDEEKAAYQEAFDAWVASGYDPELYPEYVDFMSPENRAEYEAAKEAYDAAYLVWSEKYNAFDEAYWQIYDSSPNFEFNQIALSPDGKAFAMTNFYEDDSDPTSWMPVPVDYVWVISLEGDEITKYDSLQLSAKAWADGYVLAADVDPDSRCFNGYLLKDGEYISLYDYLCGKGESIKEWVDLNMTHETEVYDWETDQVVIKTVTFTGLPVASRDMKVIASWTNSTWGDFAPESYLFDFRDSAGISSVKADNKGVVAFEANGDLTVGEGVAELAVYDLGGVCLLRVANPGANVSCDFARGVYVIKATYADGSVTAIKAVK